MRQYATLYERETIDQKTVTPAGREFLITLERAAGVV